jgi:hypothetical protein
MWVVEAIGEETGSTFTYLVDAPMEADSVSVACCAYAKHGQLHSEYLVTELLGEQYVAYWQEEVEWAAA